MCLILGGEHFRGKKTHLDTYTLVDFIKNTAKPRDSKFWLGPLILHPWGGVWLV